jgi:hypothetical protein
MLMNYKVNVRISKKYETEKMFMNYKTVTTLTDLKTMLGFFFYYETKARMFTKYSNNIRMCMSYDTSIRIFINS